MYHSVLAWCCNQKTVWPSPSWLACFCQVDWHASYLTIIIVPFVSRALSYWLDFLWKIPFLARMKNHVAIVEWLMNLSFLFTEIMYLKICSFQVAFAKRALNDPNLRMAHTVHKVSSLLGGVFFIADDVFPETPYLHAAWHLAAAVGVGTCNKLLE